MKHALPPGPVVPDGDKDNHAVNHAPPPVNGPTKPRLGYRDANGNFFFFQPRVVDMFFEGRDAHAAIKFDHFDKLFPRRIHLSLFLFLAAMALYLCTMSWSPFPGLPSSELLSKMAIEPIPSPVDMLWGWMVRIADRLPWLSTSAWMGLASAIFGALSIAVFSDLMMQVGYVIRNEPGPYSFYYEAYARRLSALCASLFLMLCLPVWVGSTRTLPATFHLFLLVCTARLFSRYQHWGRKIDLFLLGMAYGIGITEFATFIVFLPFFLFMMIRELIRWHAIRSWHCHVTLWGSLIFSCTAFYAFNAWMLYQRGLFMEIYASPVAALFDIWATQSRLISDVRLSAGFLVVMFFALMPWCISFLMTRRSPWFYEWGQILVRLICICGLLGLLYNATFAPWRLMQMTPYLVTPYLIMAGSFGYMCGEFLILSERNKLIEFHIRQRFMRFLSLVWALALPFLIAGAAVANYAAANGRLSSIVEDAAREVLDRREKVCNVFFSTGLLDDALRLITWENRDGTCVINAARTASPVYLRGIARFFAPDVAAPLKKGDLHAFLDRLINVYNRPEAIGIIDIHDLFQEFGVLVPNSYFYTIEPTFGDIDWLARYQDQRLFWDKLLVLRDIPISEDNLMFIFRKYLLEMAVRNINNFALDLIEAGHRKEGFDALMTGWRIVPNNLAVLLNLASLANEFPLPDEFDPEADVRNELSIIRGNRWNTARAYGYIRNARDWVRNGFVWALSGEPDRPINPDNAPPADIEEDALLAKWIDMAFNCYGIQRPDESVCRSRLMSDEHDTAALLALSYLAMRQNDTEMAEAYLSEALAMGLSEEDVLFERAILLYLRGDKTAAFESIRLQATYDAKSGPLWLTFLLLAEEFDEPEEISRARAAIALIRPGTLGFQLSRARHFMDRHEWDLAQNALDRAAELAPSNTILWELMGEVASKSGNTALMNVSLRALQARNPEHYIKYQNDGIMLYQQGDLEGAEEAFQKGLVQTRAPTLLNNLAHVIHERHGDYYRALALVNEAIKRDPKELSYLSTRAAINISMNDPTSALQDLLTLKKAGQMTHSRWILCTEALIQLGKCPEARRVARSIENDPALTAAEKIHLRTLLRACP